MSRRVPDTCSRLPSDATENSTAATIAARTSVRRHIAAFDPVTGAQDTAFTAQFNTPQGPEVALIGAQHLYVGGNFTKVNFLAHPGFAQFPEQGET